MGTAELPIHGGDERPVVAEPVPHSIDGTGYGVMIQSLKINTNLGRETLFSLGSRGPYHRYISFPAEVATEVEVAPGPTGCL